MFLTGLAGVGKTTTIKIAEHFCFKFCKAAGIPWSGKTFLFTAYTGSVTSAFDDVTICKATYIKKTTPLNKSDMDQQKDVQILSVDEISFIEASEMLKLDQNLQRLGDSTQPFGGFSIVFVGNLRQLDPPAAKDTDLLFSRMLGGHWENLLSAVIFLENKHRFKINKSYGRLLKRMWDGDLQVKDRKWINKRVVGRRGCVQIPKSRQVWKQ